MTVIAADRPVGVLYGAFRLLRIAQAGQSLDRLAIVERPRLALRVLNHWDNLDGTIERGYAGQSIFNWHVLPGHVSSRIIDYARAHPSVVMWSLANESALNPLFEVFNFRPGSGQRLTAVLLA